MRLRASLLFTLLATIVFAAPAQAGWNDFWGSVKQDWHRNTAWPQPWQAHEREAVRSPFRTMVNKGHQVENTLGEPYFDSNSQALNRAGEIRLRYLLSLPVQRRVVFVLVGPTRDITATRVDSVQQAIAVMMPERAMPPVYLTELAPRGWNGGQIDAMNRAYSSGQASPILGGAGGGGGGAP